jgi:hypothetical protein
MKIGSTFLGCFFIIVLSFLSCSKNKDQLPTVISPPPPPALLINQPPVARAGADTAFKLSSCGAGISVLLDGTKSRDPENKIVGASWRVISGQRDISLIYTTNRLNATVMIRRAGVYNFELQIVDNGNLISKDTVTITVTGSSPKEYDLDITSNTTYIFRDNFLDCDDITSPCTYYDETKILGTGTFAPIGLLTIFTREFSDTANLSYKGISYFDVYNANSTTTLYGSTSINLKKIIQQGGGAFTGNLNIEGGSAKYCDENIYNSLAPLLVTGNLDTATKKVSIRIKGKTFF